jgi:hypothetical protein
LPRAKNAPIKTIIPPPKISRYLDKLPNIFSITNLLKKKIARLKPRYTNIRAEENKM